jgi:uncharacterized Zn finger protein
MRWRYGYKPYVPVARRRAHAARELAKRLKKGEAVSPVVIEGRTIVSTFWGKAWCTNLESYSDFENRLPRGRTYVRNGSVVDLRIEKGRIRALVSGSELYKTEIEIVPLPSHAWKRVKTLCVGKIGSLVELLQGKLSSAVMEAVTNRSEGLFPKPSEIQMRCSCPDYAGMCKHVAAVMYGIGNRFDSSPALLFELRGVDHTELIAEAIPAAPARAAPGAPTIEASELGAIFDIEIEGTPVTTPPRPRTAAVKAAKVENSRVAEQGAPAKKGARKKPVAARKNAASKTATAKKNTLKKAAAVNQRARPVSRKG